MGWAGRGPQYRSIWAGWAGQGPQYRSIWAGLPGRPGQYRSIKTGWAGRPPQYRSIKTGWAGRGGRYRSLKCGLPGRLPEEGVGGLPVRPLLHVTAVFARIPARCPLSLYRSILHLAGAVDRDAVDIFASWMPGAQLTCAGYLVFV